MGDIFKGIDNAMSIIIAWIDAPFISSMRMRSKLQIVKPKCQSPRTI